MSIFIGTMTDAESFVTYEENYYTENLSSVFCGEYH